EDIFAVWGVVWNATATLIALILITLILDVAGMFAWLARYVAYWGRGSTLRLFIFLVLLGAALAGLLANDGAVLILTPLVMAMMAQLRFTPAATFAFVMAAGFISDAASLPLVISNLVNIVAADFFEIDFLQYASVMVPVNVVAVLASLLMLVVVFQRHLPRRFDAALLQDPKEAIHDPLTFRAGWVVLPLLLVACLVLEPFGVPISVRSEEHTSELQSRENLVCRLLLEKKKSVLQVPRRPAPGWLLQTQGAGAAARTRGGRGARGRPSQPAATAPPRAQHAGPRHRLIDG